MSVKLIILLTVVIPAIISAPLSLPRPKRGIPVSRYTHTPSLNELSNSRRVAEWSASNAVNSAVAHDYSNQLATTAQFVAQFTAPVTKEQAGRVFDTIRRSQKATQIHQALAASSRPINQAARNAANSNYDQAYQAKQLGYHRGTNSHYY